jgi:hypothetical protein
MEATPVKIRMRFVAPLTKLVAVIVLTACNPTEFAAYRMVMGDDAPATVEEATATCDAVFGVGSDQPGRACWNFARFMIHMKLSRGIDPNYQWLQDCHSAVDVVFAGRWDFSRAHMVVQRESNNIPSAISPTGHRGCGQLSQGLRDTWLKGPWDDPYWNVRAIRDIVDSDSWCHWDLRNYCSAGGEFGP